MKNYIGTLSLSWAYICLRCGCLVDSNSIELHDQFHDKLDKIGS